MFKYTCFLSRPIELDLVLQKNDIFFRPRGKLLWGTPLGSYTYEDFMYSLDLDETDPFYKMREQRVKYGYEFEVTQSEKIYFIDANHELNSKYIIGTQNFNDGNRNYESFLINFTAMKSDGFCGIEINFDNWGGIPQEYVPWTQNSIAIWDSSIISNVQRIK